MERTPLLPLAVLLMVWSSNLNGQILKGTVLDRDTEEPVPFADIYFSGSQRGTSADKQGKFTLDAAGFFGRPLTVSAIGYYSHTLNACTNVRPLNVLLVPKVYEIEGVELEYKSLEGKRKQYMRHFRREFLGTTRNGRNCLLMNEEDIRFDYRIEDTIRAYCMKPLGIHNQSLGYQITYYLDHFEYITHEERVFFTGSILFAEDLTTPARTAEKRRWRAYQGSRMHFIRSLWANKLEENNFSMDCLAIPIEYEDLVLVTEKEECFLRYHQPVSIYYFTTWSSFHFLKNQVFIDSDGYFDPEGLRWGGQMARKRIGDWLPYEYTPE